MGSDGRLRRAFGGGGDGGVVGECGGFFVEERGRREREALLDAFGECFGLGEGEGDVGALVWWIGLRWEGERVL